VTDTENHDPADRSSRLFDLRLIIGGIFAVYGVVLIIAGLADSSAEIDKAAGIRINLWVGIGMLIVGAIFLAWARLRPVRLEETSAAARADRQS
jgi:xanthine/uracil/vitamin C permease (AzgA family)